MKHIWSLACKKSVIDQETNNISISEVVERVVFTLHKELPEEAFKQLKDGKPLVLPYQHEIVSLWTKEEDEIGTEVKRETKVEFFKESKKLGESRQEIIIPKAARRMRTRVRGDVLPISGSGQYYFKVRIKDKNSFKTVAEIPLEVVVKQKENS